MQHHVLDNATLWLGDGRELSGHVIVQDDAIGRVEAGRYSGSLPITDLQGSALSPGLIDLMVVGAFGVGLLEGNLSRIAKKYVRLGVTGIQFCSSNLSWADYERLAGHIRCVMERQSPDAAEVLGVYHEGPFMQPESCGGNRADLCVPASAANVVRFLDAFGDTISMINVSPGIEGDASAVRRFVAAGKVVTMCHSNAPAERAMECISAGTSVLGHAWDNNVGLAGDSGLQMPTIEHAALLDERIRFLHVIADGFHVHPLWIELALRCRGIGTVCLVSDTVPCAGMPDGDYRFDDGQYYAKLGGVARDANGDLFGAAMLLPDQFRNFVRMTRLAPAQAIRSVTYNAAACLGIEDRLGLIAPGRSADLVAWDRDLRVTRVWCRGREIQPEVGCGEQTPAQPVAPA